MDWEPMGTGAFAGFFASIVAILGWNKRFDRLEDNKCDKETCEKDMNAHAKAIEDMKDDLTYIRSRVDKLIDLQINGRKG